MQRVKGAGACFYRLIFTDKCPGEFSSHNVCIMCIF